MNTITTQHTTTSETQSAILDWVQATEEFHRYHGRINEILREKAHTSYGLSTTISSTGTSKRISHLSKLRQHMNDVLETLLADMNSASENASFNLSRAGRLVTHARLLKEINQKISKELLLFTAFRA